jgi:hypothetical protein
MALLARFEAGVGEHPAQVDDQLPVDVLVVWRLQDLGLAAELDLDLAVGLLIGKDQLGWVGGSRPGSRWT